MNLSDLAAKGATPLGFLLSLALPKEIGDDWLADFAKACAATPCCLPVRCSAATPMRTPGPVTISIAMFGSVPEGTMVRRAGAKPGDLRVRHRHHRRCRARAWLAQGRERWKLDDAQRQHLVSRYLLPQPRNALAEAVRTHASARDGCVGWARRRSRQALPRVRRRGRDRRRPRAAVRCRQSRASRPTRDAARPRSPAATITKSSAPCRPAKADSFRAAAKAANVPVTEIGDDRSGRGRPVSRCREASRSPSSAPPSAISDNAATRWHVQRRGANNRTRTDVERAGKAQCMT